MARGTGTTLNGSYVAFNTRIPGEMKVRCCYCDRRRMSRKSLVYRPLTPNSNTYQPEQLYIAMMNER